MAGHPSIESPSHRSMTCRIERCLDRARNGQKNDNITVNRFSDFYQVFFSEFRRRGGRGFPSTAHHSRLCLGLLPPDRALVQNKIRSYHHIVPYYHASEACKATYCIHSPPRSLLVLFKLASASATSDSVRFGD
jgi:hypothetical protein